MPCIITDAESERTVWLPLVAEISTASPWSTDTSTLLQKKKTCKWAELDWTQTSIECKITASFPAWVDKTWHTCWFCSPSCSWRTRAARLIALKQQTIVRTEACLYLIYTASDVLQIFITISTISRNACTYNCVKSFLEQQLWQRRSVISTWLYHFYGNSSFTGTRTTYAPYLITFMEGVSGFSPFFSKSELKL